MNMSKLTEAIREYEDYQESGGTASEENIKMYILVNAYTGLQKGKMCAQVGHAVSGMTEIMLKENRKKWKKYTRSGSAKIVLKVTSEEDFIDILDQTKSLRKCYIVDAGKTQCASGTTTAVAYTPMHSDVTPSCIRTLGLY